MKRIGCMVLALLFAVSLSACGISLNEEGPAVLTYHGGAGKTATLTAEETERVKEILEDADYFPEGSGCPFKHISVSFGDQVFGIASDGHNIVLDMQRERYYEISYEDLDYIGSLFQAYMGFFPYP